HQRWDTAHNRLLLGRGCLQHVPEFAGVILLLQITLKRWHYLWRNTLQGRRDVVLRQEIPVFAALIRIEHAIAEGIVELNRSINLREYCKVVVAYLKDHARQCRDEL